MTEEARKLADKIEQAIADFYPAWERKPDFARFIAAAIQPGTLARENIMHVLERAISSGLLRGELADAILALTPSHEAGTLNPAEFNGNLLNVEIVSYSAKSGRGEFRGKPYESGTQPNAAFASIARAIYRLREWAKMEGPYTEIIKEAAIIEKRVEQLKHAAPEAGTQDERQRVVIEWGERAFGVDHMRDKIVRAARFFEEAAEMVQAVGLPRDHAQRAFNHVYSRAPGDPVQEAGGVANTLMALCGAIGLSLDECQRAEIERCLAKDPAHFAARNQAKLREVDAAPEAGTQEPVAWRTPKGDGKGYFFVENIAVIAEHERKHFEPVYAAPASQDATRDLDFFSENVDRWGAAEWFDRLARAIKEQDAAVVAKDEAAMDICRNVAASSAMRLVRDYEQHVRAALASPARADRAVTADDREEFGQQVRAIAIEECCEIVQAIDSGRGNEKEILKAIRALRSDPPPEQSK